jgi:hypothetical protein
VNRTLQILLGSVAVLYASGLLLIAVLTHNVEYHTMFVRAFFRTGLPLLALGMLSLIGVRVAAFFLAVPLFFVGVVLVFSFLKVPFPWFLVNCFFGSVFMTPAILLVRERVLRRKGT